MADIVEVVNQSNNETLGFIEVKDDTKGIPISEYREEVENTNLNGFIHWLRLEKGIECEEIRPTYLRM